MSWKKPLLKIKLRLILIQERRPKSSATPVHLVLVVFWYKRNESSEGESEGELEPPDTNKKYLVLVIF